jgi:hypothetical protein
MAQTRYVSRIRLGRFDYRWVGLTTVDRGPCDVALILTAVARCQPSEPDFTTLVLPIEISPRQVPPKYQ